MKNILDFRFGVIWIVVMVGAYAQDNLCGPAQKQISKYEALVPHYLSGRIVIGAGRAYFYSSPDLKCKEKDVFVISGDRLDAYSDYKGFTSVMYVNFKTGQDFEGWVLKSRLKETGTGMAPKEEYEGNVQSGK